MPKGCRSSRRLSVFRKDRRGDTCGLKNFNQVRPIGRQSPSPFTLYASNLTGSLWICGGPPDPVCRSQCGGFGGCWDARPVSSTETQVRVGARRDNASRGEHINRAAIFDCEGEPVASSAIRPSAFAFFL